MMSDFHTGTVTSGTISISGIIMWPSLSEVYSDVEMKDLLSELTRRVTPAGNRIRH